MGSLIKQNYVSNKINVLTKMIIKTRKQVFTQPSIQKI